MDIIKDASQNISGRLAWHTAGRDQAGIAKELADGDDIPEVYGVVKQVYLTNFFISLTILVSKIFS